MVIKQISTEKMEGTKCHCMVYKIGDNSYHCFPSLSDKIKSFKGLAGRQNSLTTGLCGCGRKYNSPMASFQTVGIIVTLANWRVPSLPEGI